MGTEVQGNTDDLGNEDLEQGLDNNLDLDDAGLGDKDPGESTSLGDVIDKALAETAKAEGVELEDKKDPEKPGQSAADPGNAKPDVTGKDQEDEVFKEPEGLSDKASERFQALVTRAKDSDARFESLATDHQTLLDTINSSTTPEGFHTMIQYARVVNNPDAPEADLKRALEFVEAERRILAHRLGVEAPGVDLLKDHPDLAEKVENFELSRDDAVMIATTRDRNTMQNARKRQSSEQQAMQQTQEAAISQLNHLDAQLRQNDVDYEAKRKLLDTQLPMIYKNYSPDQWANAVWELWQTFPTLPRQHRPSRHEQPLSGGSRRGSSNGKPKTMLEAVNMGLNGVSS